MLSVGVILAVVIYLHSWLQGIVCTLLMVTVYVRSVGCSRPYTPWSQDKLATPRCDNACAWPDKI